MNTTFNRKVTLIGIISILLQFSPVGFVQAFDMSGWLSNWHFKLDFAAAPVRVTKPAQPVDFYRCSDYDCEVFTIHDESLDVRKKTDAQLNWQIPLYMNERLTLGVDGVFAPLLHSKISATRNTSGGYLKYAISDRFSVLGQIGLSRYSYSRWEKVVMTSGRSHSALTLAAGVRFYPLRALSLQATVQHVGAARIDNLTHTGSGQTIPGVFSPQVTFGDSLSVLFSVGLHLPFVSEANRAEAVGQHAFAPELQGAPRSFADSIVKEILRTRSTKSFTALPPGGIAYDEESDTLTIRLKYYKSDSQHQWGLRYSSSSTPSHRMLPPNIRSELFDDLVRAVGRQVQNSLPKLVGAMWKRYGNT